MGPFQLSDYLGQVVVIAFFAPNWPVCSPELSDLETSIWQAYQDNGLQFIGISNTNNQNIINNYINSLLKPLENKNFFSKTEARKAVLISGVNGVGETFQNKTHF